MQKLAVFAFALILLFGCSGQQKQPKGQLIITLGPDDELINQTQPTNETNTTAPEAPKPPEITSFSVTTDKPTYFSQETINITTQIEASGDIPGVLVLIYGIDNNRGGRLLNQNKLFYLREGVHSANFTFELPYCSYCSGMPQGTYYIYANASKDNLTLALANCSFNFSTGPSG